MTKEPQSKFIFSSHEWDKEERVATFFYRLEHHGEAFNFTERLAFSKEYEVAEVPEKLLNNALNNLLLALGISYYKLFCPREIVIEGFTLTSEQAEFWNTVYTKGLGEFFYKNQIDFRGLIHFPVGKSGSQAISFPRKDRVLVGIGGGKDSIVAAEMMKEQKKEIVAFTINDHPIKQQVIETLGVETLFVKREIDPLLLELNKRSGSYNGHIPFSCLVAFIALFTALVYDYRAFVVGNERSANYGNVQYLGEEMNHQWSKSFEFETLFQKYVAAFITPDVFYFSLLRPWSEVSVTKKFSQFESYFSVFSSCNKNFRIISQTEKRWCGECAKCAFAFAMLAAFLPKETVLDIFGDNLFAKDELLQTYKELLGVANIKPFDCVGTPEEVQAAFYLAMEKDAYNDDIIMQFYKEEVLPTIQNIEMIKREVFEISKEQSIPKQFQNVVTI